MRKLRKEVKILIGVVIIIFIIVLDHSYTEKNVSRCINSGIDSQVCEELR